MRTLFVFAILGAGLGAAMVSRYAALLLYLWYTFFRPQAWVWFDLDSWRLSFVLGAVLVVPALVNGILPNVTHPLSVGGLVFLCAALLAQTNAVDPALGWNGIDALARMLIVCMLAVTMISTRQRFLMALAVMAGSFGFHAAKAGLASMLKGGLQFYEGVGGAFSDNNGFGIGTAMVIFLLVAVGQNADRRWQRYGLYAAAAISLFTVISTFSRGAFLALIAATLTFMLLQRRRMTVLCVILGLAGLALLFAPIPDRYFDRVETISTYDKIEDESALGRLHFWRVASQMAQDHPLGIGLRNYEATYDRYDTSEGRFGTRRAVHSSHFQVLAESGYLGAAAWIGLFACAFGLALRVRSRASLPGITAEERQFLFTTANALVTSMVAFLVGGAFVALAFNEMTWVTFALVASLDRLAAEMCARVVPAPAAAVASAPVVFAPGLPYSRAPVHPLGSRAYRARSRSQERLS